MPSALVNNFTLRASVLPSTSIRSFPKLQDDEQQHNDGARPMKAPRSPLTLHQPHITPCPDRAANVQKQDEARLVALTILRDIRKQARDEIDRLPASWMPATSIRTWSPFWVSPNLASVRATAALALACPISMQYQSSEHRSFEGESGCQPTITQPLSPCLLRSL